MYIIENEIMTQHEALQQTFALIESKREEITSLLKAKIKKNIIFVGCGSSYMLARSGAEMFSMRTSLKALSLAGGDFLLNPLSYKALLDDSLVVLITRSGKTSEIDYAIDKIHKISNAQIICIHSRSGTPIPQKSDYEIALDWAYDESVCQTRNISNFYLAISLLYAYYAKDENLVLQLRKVVLESEAYISEKKAALQEIGALKWNNATVLADGEITGIAQEGALAFCEICMKFGQYYHLLDFRHGPAVLINENSLVILVITGNNLQYQLDLVSDLKRKGATIVTVSDQAEIANSDLNVQIKGVSDYIAWGVPFIFVPQMIAFSKAISEGHNPDCPDGLNAYITL